MSHYSHSGTVNSVTPGECPLDDLRSLRQLRDDLVGVVYSKEARAHLEWEVGRYERVASRDDVRDAVSVALEEVAFRWLYYPSTLVHLDRPFEEVLALAWHHAKRRAVSYLANQEYEEVPFRRPKRRKDAVTPARLGPQKVLWSDTQADPEDFTEAADLRAEMQPFVKKLLSQVVMDYPEVALFYEGYNPHETAKALGTSHMTVYRHLKGAAEYARRGLLEWLPTSGVVLSPDLARSLEAVSPDGDMTQRDVRNVLGLLHLVAFRAPATLPRRGKSKKWDTADQQALQEAAPQN